MASLARPLTPGRGAKCVICNTDSSPDLLVSCLGCGVTVHIDEYYTHWEKGEEIPAEWYCKLCEVNNARPDYAPKCVLCLKTTFKYPYLPVQENEKLQHIGKTLGSHWAHAHCVNFNKEPWQDTDSTAVVNLDVKGEVAKDEAYWYISKDRVNLECMLCKKTGLKHGKYRSICCQCSEETCTYAFHVTCGLLNQRKKFHTIVDFEKTSFQMFCPDHSSKFKKKKAAKRKKKKLDASTSVVRATSFDGASKITTTTTTTTITTGKSKLSDDDDNYVDTQPSKKRRITEVSGNMMTDEYVNQSNEKGPAVENSDEGATLKSTKLRRISSTDAKDLYSSTEISNAKRTITELINEETNTFHGDDMEKLVQCMFKCINVNTQINVLKALRNSNLSCIHAFLQQPYPETLQFCKNSTVSDDDFRPSKYGGLIAICKWIYKQQKFSQVDRPALYKQFVYFIKELDLSHAQLRIYKVGATYQNSKKTKIKFQAMGKIIKELSESSEKSNIYGTAREIYEGYEKEQGQIKDVFKA